MLEYDTSSHKTDGFTLKPARVELSDNRTIEAVHHFTNSSEQTLCLYINERDGGIDLKIPLDAVVVIAKTAAGAGAIGPRDEEETERMRLGSGTNGKAHRHDRVESEEDDELAADGGR